MYIYRALSESDIKLEPKKNGLFGKKIVTENTYGIYELILSQEGIYFNNKKEKEEVFRYEKADFIVNNTKNEIIKDGKENNRIAFEKIILLGEHYKSNMQLLSDEKFKECLLYIDSILNNVKTHVYRGNVIDTNWISFTKNKEKLWSYYKNQKNNQVAVIDSNIHGYLDKNLVALDLSSPEAVEYARELLIINDKTGMRETSDGFVGFNFSKDDEELDYYNHVPSDRILRVLDQFEFDLIYNNILDEQEFYSQTEREKNCIIQDIKVKKILYNILKSEEKYLLDYLKVLYKENISVNELVLNNGSTKEELGKAKRKILSYLEPNEALGIKPFNKEKLSFIEEK